MSYMDKPLFELIQADRSLASVIDRFGIGFEHYKLPLDEACKSSSVDTKFVVTIYNAFAGSNYFPAEDLQKFPLRTIIEYLIKTHVYYINNKLPKLERLIDVLITNYGNSELLLFKLKDFFTEYKRNLFHHIQSEELSLFPYVLKMINAVEEKADMYTVFQLLEKYSLQRFTNDHDHADDALGEIGRRIRNYTIAYPERAQVSLILDELKQFEKDLDLHAKLEDEVLLPLAQNLEDGLKAKLLSRCVNN